MMSPTPSLRIIGPPLQRPTECEAVLRTLPQWFGLEQALKEYVEDTVRWPTLGWADEDRLIGFLTLREHFPAAWEVHCMAIDAGARGRGLGTALLAYAEQWLVQRGARFLQVKTLAATRPSPEYAQTRAFYASRGFTPIEVFPELWDPWNPALQCIKCLAPPPPTVPEHPPAAPWPPLPENDPP